MLHIDAFPQNPSFSLGNEERVPILVTTSSGDREEGLLFRAICPARERSWGYPCFTFLLGMHSGFTVTDVADRVAAIGGRFGVVAGPLGSVTLPDARVVQRRAREARSWPGVAFTELSGGAVGQAAVDLRRQLTVPLPLDTGPALALDRVIQVRAGDSITVSYLQPSGAVSTVIQVVP